MKAKQARSGVANSPPLAKLSQNERAKVGLVYSPAMMKHEDPMDTSHPEQPARISRIFEEVEATGLLRFCRRLPFSAAQRKDLARVHTSEWLDEAEDLRLRDADSTKGKDEEKASEEEEDGEDEGGPSLGELVFTAKQFDSVYLNEHSVDCALLSAGGTLECVRQVLLDRCHNAVAIVRPPGHHAEAHCAKGFCLYNNVAVAAAAARQWGVERVLVVDWDVHHGNGTQHMFERDPHVLFFSTHRYEKAKFYPCSEDADSSKVGTGKGKGFNINVAWQKGGMGDGDYLHAWQRVLMPVAREYAPQLVLISAGFDAARGDPLGGCDVTPRGFAEMTRQLAELCPGKLVLVLEGGYNLRSISTSFAACVAALRSPNVLENTPEQPGSSFTAHAVPYPTEPLAELIQAQAAEESGAVCVAESGQDEELDSVDGDVVLLSPSKAGRQAVRATLRYHRRFWSCLDPDLEWQRLKAASPYRSKLSMVAWPLVEPRQGRWGLRFGGPVQRLSRFSRAAWALDSFFSLPPSAHQREEMAEDKAEGEEEAEEEDEEGSVFVSADQMDLEEEDEREEGEEEEEEDGEEDELEADALAMAIAGEDEDEEEEGKGEEEEEEEEEMVEEAELDEDAAEALAAAQAEADLAQAEAEAELQAEFAATQQDEQAAAEDEEEQQQQAKAAQRKRRNRKSLSAKEQLEDSPKPVNKRRKSSRF